MRTSDADAILATPSRTIAAARVVVGAVLVHMVIGSFFSWGNLTVYVTSYLRRSHGADYTFEQTTWMMSICGSLISFFAYSGGQLHASLGLRGTTLLGGLVLTTGVMLSSVSIRYGFWPFMGTYAIAFGVGGGIAYSAPVKCAMLWMPNYKGLSSGLVMCGVGGGAFAFNIVQAVLVNPGNVMPVAHGASSGDLYYEDADLLDRVPLMFLVLGIIFLVMTVAGSFCLSVPSEEYDPLTSAGGMAGTGGTSGVGSDSSYDGSAQFTPGEMLRTREFWLIWWCYFLNMQGVGYVSGFCKVFGQREIAGITDHQLTSAAAVGALLNGLGRPLWGLIGDNVSFRAALIGISVLMTVFLATLGLCRYGGFLMYFTWMGVLFFGVGGASSIFAGTVSAYFGSVHFGLNFGLMVMAAGFAWVVHALSVQIFRQLLGDVGLSIAMACAALLATMCAIALRNPPRTEADHRSDLREPLTKAAEEGGRDV